MEVYIIHVFAHHIILPVCLSAHVYDVMWCVMVYVVWCMMWCDVVCDGVCGVWWCVM